MKKLFKSKKALSPVIASIILIAVTVAVSIAVAAWMGALSFGFMATEQLSFTDCTYNSVTDVAIKVKNTGTSSLTLSKVFVNGVDSTGVSAVGTSWTLEPNAEETITITPTAGFEAGANYAFMLQTSKNNQFGPYTKAAPS